MKIASSLFSLKISDDSTRCWLHKCIKSNMFWVNQITLPFISLDCKLVGSYLCLPPPDLTMRMRVTKAITNFCFTVTFRGNEWGKVLVFALETSGTLELFQCQSSHFLVNVTDVAKTLVFSLKYQLNVYHKNSYLLSLSIYLLWFCAVRGGSMCSDRLME